MDTVFIRLSTLAKRVQHEYWRHFWPQNSQPKLCNEKNRGKGKVVLK